MVGFIDSDDDRNLGVVRVVQGFHGLRHHPVVGGHHQDDDVGHVGAAGAHGAEGGVARRVQKSDLLNLPFAFGMRKGNGVCADVLGDPSGLPGGHIGFADDIQQRRLAVVHMAHDGDDGRAGAHLLGFVLDVQFHLLVHLVDGAAAAHPLFHFKTEAELGANLARDLLLDGLVDAGKNPQFHQLLNDLKRLAFQVFGQVAHDDGRLEGDQFARGGRDDSCPASWPAPSPARPVLAGGFCAAGLWPWAGARAGAADAPPRTPRISPRPLKSVRRTAEGRAAAFSGGGRGRGLGGSCIKPTFSPSFGTGGGGGGGAAVGRWRRLD